MVEVSDPRLFTRRLFHGSSDRDIKNDFTVVSYNTLADVYLLESTAYQYCHERFKKRNEVGSHRHELLLQELEWLDSDILCLQEVDHSYYNGLLCDSLTQLGYHGHFGMYINKSGIATYFRTDVFELVMQKTVSLSDRMVQMCEEYCHGQKDLEEHFREVPQSVLLMALKHKISNQMLIIANVHIGFDWYTHPVRQQLEVCAASKIVHEFKASFEAVHPTLQDVPYVFCGDFNIEPHFPAYKVLRYGGINKEELKALESTHYIKYYEDEESHGRALAKISEKDHAVLTHMNKYFESPLRQKSTYLTILGREPEVTNHEKGEDYFILDYLWYSSDSLCPTGVLDVVPLSLVDSVVGLPNEFFPSDHLSLKASYCFINKQ